MEKKTLISDMEEIGGLARRLTLETGYHMPTLFIRSTKQKIAMDISDFPPDYEQKIKKMFDAGAKLAEATEKEGRKIRELQNLIFVSEAWFSKVEKGKEYIQPSRDPNRLEVLIVSGLDARSGKQLVMTYEFVRNERGKLLDLKKLETERAEAESELLPSFIRGLISKASEGK